MVEPIVSKIIAEILATKERALLLSFEREGIDPIVENFKRVTELKVGIGESTFFFDYKEPGEKILFFLKEPSAISPTLRVWYPGEVTVTADPEVKFTFKMSADGRNVRRNNGPFNGRRTSGSSFHRRRTKKKK